nr:immunoglobulin heavy chain junction region [Mus musculus]
CARLPTVVAHYYAMDYW